jgi:hypothetical protein
MDNFIFDISLALIGIVVGIIVALVGERAKKWLLLAFGLLLFLSAGLWLWLKLGAGATPSTQTSQEQDNSNLSGRLAYEGWIVCWHGSRGYELLVAYPEAEVRKGIELTVPVKGPSDNQLMDVTNDSLKMCLFDGVWYGEDTLFPSWFPNVSYLRLEDNKFLLCADTPGCAGQRWIMSPSAPAPPEIQGLLIPPAGNESQVLGYVTSTP